MYDIIVLGAGPAGATAAKILAEGGCHVLLAEKFKMPRYKSCSGQLIQKSLDLVRRYFGAEVPSSVTCTPSENRGMVFTDDTGRTFRFEQKGLNVWRSSFDAWLAKRAEAAGAVLLDGWSAISCEQEITCGQEITCNQSDCCVPETAGMPNLSRPSQNAATTASKPLVSILFRTPDGTTRSEQANYVIDCEGVIGTIKRQLTGVKPDYITTYQTFLRGSIDLDPHYFYAYLQPELSEYDAWFNVKDERLVLGVSVKNKEKERYYYEQFLLYMKQHYGLKIDATEKCDRWLMPHIKPGCAIDYGIGRVLFAGETAGFLNPMGEGISAAMESAACAANAVLRHMDDPAAVHAAYQENTVPLHDYMKRQWSLVGGMAKTFAEMR